MGTSKLQKLTREFLFFHFGKEKIIENYRPVWLQNELGNRLELDFYFEGIEVAIEVQGSQHFEFVKFYHKDKIGFEKRKRWDETKRIICIKRGIRLLEVCHEKDLRIVYSIISKVITPESNLPSIEKAIVIDYSERKKLIKGEKQSRIKIFIDGNKPEATSKRNLRTIMFGSEKDIEKAKKRLKKKIEANQVTKEYIYQLFCEMENKGRTLEWLNNLMEWS